MKVSIITVVLNNEQTIETSIKSVLSQTYKDIEYIIVDGGSTDNTLEIIKRYGEQVSKFISEPDDGLYDAMNKGIGLATGDVVGILNSDDFYADDCVIERVVSNITEKEVDSCYADAIYVRRDNPGKTTRFWKSCPFTRNLFKKGWMPPHATFFARRCFYERYGMFRTDMPVAADYELMLRFLYKYEISTTYIPQVLVKISNGGKSTPNPCTVLGNMIENYRAWKVNGLKTSPLTFLCKPLFKVSQFLKR
jgi:glycosyltransferase involved in cell wall biosynthesis